MKPIMRDIIDIKRNLKIGYHLSIFLENEITIIVNKEDQITVKDNYFIIKSDDMNKIVFLNKIILIAERADKYHL